MAASASVATSMCRLCLGYCGIRVEIEDGRATKVTGDPDNPLSRGFTCAKGRALPEQLAAPSRLLRSLSRGQDGELHPAAVADVVDALARGVESSLGRYGPRSVATYLGTGAAAYRATNAVAGAFMSAIGSPMLFHPGTIDQPGKQVAASLHGRWDAGPYALADADVWMFVGTNPIVSMWGGLTLTDPLRALQEARRRGLRLVVVDPRRTELAAMADVHLRPRPGEDAALAAGLLRGVLVDGREDRAFCAEHVRGVDALRAAVEPFSPDEVARRTGVDPAALARAADLLASSRRGGISAGTGANMTPDGTLIECLLLALHTVCGYWPRAGERVANPGVLVPERSFLAQARPGPPAYGEVTMRARPLAATSAGMPTAALADEILYDGDDRVRVLLNVGGNPVAAWPDQLKTIEAMRALELLACFDVRLGATTRYAHHVVAARFALEVPQVTGSERGIEIYGATSSLFQVPYGMWSPAVVEPPPGAEVVEEWEVFLGIAARLGLTLRVGGEAIDPGDEPTTDELYDVMFRGSRVPLDEVRRHEHGHVFDEGAPVVVLPAEQGHGHLAVADPLVLEGLRSLAARPTAPASGDLPFLLISRRMKNAKNSAGLDIESLRRPHRTNPAFMHPEDLAALGLVDGDAVDVRSARAAIPAVVAADTTLPIGVVSMSHAWGDAPDRDGEFRELGSCTSRLVDNDHDVDPITGMPRMTALPVAVTSRSG